MSEKKNNILLVAAIICSIITLVVILGSVWYWAIFGMDKNIGEANMVTCMVFGFLSFTLFMSWSQS